MKLSGKSAVITGAGSGLGRASTLLYTQEGASVVVADRDEERANDTAPLVKEPGGTAVAVRCDVAVEADVAHAVDTAVDRLGTLDVMFANAGVPTPNRVEPIDEITEEAWNTIVGVNLTGVVWSAKHAARVLPALVPRGPGRRAARLDRQRWRTRVELANAIFEYLEGFYNRHRRHYSLE